PDVLAFYHSDGVIDEIIPDLIKIGVDILNPIQPECVNPIRLKELYGDKLSFWGTIGTQTTMPFGTENEVRENVRKMIETVGKGGGFCVAPTHLLEPEVPWVNINAFVSAVNDFGKY
ncbi:MAG: uroporphyrinogen decarboxylase family protein, partial [Oscillospiraceae bacterium]